MFQSLLQHPQADNRRTSALSRP